MDLPTWLWEIKEEIKQHAIDYGLDFFDTHFEIVDYKAINEIAAYGGFPTRYNHWRFGMEYEQLSKSHEYGLAKIYEMVINNDPAYAYLLEGNNIVDQKTVIAHVFAHVDFFKNNFYFSKTKRRMIDEMANHATRIRRYIDRLGLAVVEDFIETCLSVDNLIDVHLPFVPQKRPDEEHDYEELGVPRLKNTRSYLEPYINPKEFLDEQRKKLEEERQKSSKVPESPQKDALLFLLQHAPLETWEADVLSIIRDEAYYFAPQGQTKIMNEGWATYWHSKIMTERALEASEIIDYADAFAGVVATAPGQLNPYKLGVELWRNIEERWNRGQFGAEWERCEDLDLKNRWDRHTGKGREKIFEVRKLYNDITFLDEFLTEDFCREQKLFVFAYNQRNKGFEIASREFKEIKEKLLFQLTNFGQPFIYVKDSNYKNRAELLLHHKFEGTELRMDYAKDVLENLFRIWKRTVNIETIVKDKGRLFSYDGQEHRDTPVDYQAL